MMDNLRTASNHVVLKIILGLIIISFVLTGVGNYLIGGNHDYAAKVNGETISRAQLENAFSNERTRQQQRLGEQYAQLAGNEQFIQQLRQQVLSQLIDTRLLQQYAQRLHLNISDKQIRQAIFEVPEFQKNGHFDNERFTSLLSSVGLTPDAYAASLRLSLANRQLVESVLSTDFMLPAEINSLVALVAQQRLVRQAIIKTSDLAAKQHATPGEISGYYQTHKDQFKGPEQFRVSYIQLDAAALQKTPDETQIQKWYSSHKSDYIQQARERFSVIQLKTEAEAQALVKKLQQGGDFAALARQYSQDPVSAKQGGDLGWMELDSVPDEIKRIGLKQKGELSGAVKSSAGYIIVRLNDQQAEQVQSLAAVHDAVAEKVKQETAIRLFYTLQQKVNDAASNDNESLASAEQVAGVKASETGWFDQNTLPEELNFDPVKQVLFNGSLLGSDGARGSNSGIVPVDGDRAFVVRITAHQPESTKSLNEVSDQIAQQITQDKAQQIAKASAQKIVAELQQNKREAFTQAGLTFGPAQQLDRNHPQAMTETVFNLPHPQTDKPVYGSAQDAQGNMVILALDKVTEGKLTDVQQQQLVKGMTQNNAQLMFDAIMQQLRQQAKIKYGDAVHMQ